MHPYSIKHLKDLVIRNIEALSPSCFKAVYLVWYNVTLILNSSADVGTAITAGSGSPALDCTPHIAHRAGDRRVDFAAFTNALTLSSAPRSALLPNHHSSADVGTAVTAGSGSLICPRLYTTYCSPRRRQASRSHSQPSHSPALRTPPQPSQLCRRRVTAQILLPLTRPEKQTTIYD